MLKTLLDIIQRCEAALEIKGKLTLKLASLTKGFLPDLTLDLGEQTALATGGKGGSGLEAGFYIGLKIPSPLNLITKILGHFTQILKVFGIKPPKPSNAMIDFGLMATIK